MALKTRARAVQKDIIDGYCIVTVSIGGEEHDVPVSRAAYEKVLVEQK
jgi:hypothetical protein